MRTRLEFTRSALSIAEAETLQNVVAPETASGPAARSWRSIEQTTAVRGVVTVMSPAFVSVIISFVSETALPENFGMSPFVAADHVFAQSSAGFAAGSSATYEPMRWT